jgi:hypothetical protein
LGIAPSTDVLRTGKRPRHAATIRELSDDVLIEIFDFSQKNHNPHPRYFTHLEAVWGWRLLVHVCQRWQQVVFDSPLRLNLQILCTHGTPVRKNLDIWPPFPIQIEYHSSHIWFDKSSKTNIVAALQQPDRVRAIGLQLPGPLLGNIAMVMQQPFPILRYLSLSMDSSLNYVPVLPHEFLGRSAPCLQTISLSGISFPALSALLLSTNDLVTLYLFNIPQTGYISPEAMVASLASLTRLKYLHIEFKSPDSCPDQIVLPPVTRAVLPALAFFEFSSVCKYLEDFLARISAPRLHQIGIYYFNQLVDFEVPQLWQVH